jgi:hypothetical protein
MRPLDQTSYGIHDGNCFSACIASILEVPLWGVPYFWGPRQPCFARWLAGRGLTATLYPRAVHVPSGYSIAGGHSPRFVGKMHACIALDGVVVHDPHPSRSRDGLPLGVVEYVVIHVG